jgi:hypothetical protein
MSRVLIIWGKPSRVRGLCNFSGDDFLESVDTFARGVEGVHEMHGEDFLWGAISGDIIEEQWRIRTNFGREKW